MWVSTSLNNTVVGPEKWQECLPTVSGIVKAGNLTTRIGTPSFHYALPVRKVLMRVEVKKLFLCLTFSHSTVCVTLYKAVVCSNLKSSWWRD